MRFLRVSSTVKMGRILEWLKGPAIQTINYLCMKRPFCAIFHSVSYGLKQIIHF